MAELLAAFFVLAGATVSLIAAIGVARLPDAFLRMHAATKAGVVGAGFVLLGVAFAFDSGGAWLRVGLIIVFLLVTVPISSHALGRAAYVGGAPMWSGTVMDDLRGILPRHAIDAEPSSRPPIPFASPEGGPLHDTSPRRIMLALADAPGAEEALKAGLVALATPRSEVTLYSLLCAPSLSRSGPLPIGGASHARRLMETRMAAAREAAASLAARMEAGCEASGLDFRTRHEEGDAAVLLARAATHHDVTVMARHAWFDQAQVMEEGLAGQRAASLALPGLLLAAPDFTTPTALHFLHEGDLASSEALKRFLGLNLFTALPLTISALDVEGAEEALGEALAMAATRGRIVARGAALLHPDNPPPLADFSSPTLAVIPARSSSGRQAWRALRDMESSVLLA